MKIISLNAWCGRAGSVLHEFFENNQDVDIFCLQEVDLDGTKFGPDVTNNNAEPGDPHLFSSLEKILSNHHGYFSPTLDRWWGNALFIKKVLYRNVSSYGELVISDEQQKYVPYESWFRRTIQWVDFSKNNKNYTVINIHGLWEKGRGKGDSPDRIEQSKNIINFLETKKDRNIILMGDFNLNPETQSMNLLEEFGLKNCIKEFNITSTRTSLYTKESRFADYALISPEIIIKDFKVLPEEVSDHSALYLEIE